MNENDSKNHGSNYENIVEEEGTTKEESYQSKSTTLCTTSTRYIVPLSRSPKHTIQGS